MSAVQPDPAPAPPPAVSPLERFPYRVTARRRGSRRAFGLGAGILFAVLAILVGVQQLLAGEPLLAAAGTSFLGILALTGFGAAMQPRPSGGFRYLNATVMTRAERPTADSWVHLAPTLPQPVVTKLAFAWAAVASLCGSVTASLQATGVAPRLNPEAGLPALLFAAIALLLLSLVCGWVAWAMISQRTRTGTYGRRPAGIALGASGVSVRVPGRDAEIPWQSVVGVDASLTRLGRDAEVPMIRIHLNPAEAGVPLQYVPVAAVNVPPDALYTALRWYFAHPEARRELGRVEGERRLDAWRNSALESGG